MWPAPRHQLPGALRWAVLGVLMMVVMSACRRESVAPEPSEETVETSITYVATSVPTHSAEPGPQVETTTSAPGESPTSSSTTGVSDATSADTSPSTSTAAASIPTTSTVTEPTAATSSTTAAPSVTTSTAPDDLSVVEVMVREGRAVSDGRVEVPLGSRILLRFDSDTGLLVHIHGYDQEFSVEADATATHELVADLPGIFEVEDHVSHRLLIELKVSP